MKNITPKIPALVLLLMLVTQLYGQAQSEKLDRFRYQVGLDFFLSRVEGESPAYLRQYASDVGTNWGRSAQYQRAWTPSFGLHAHGELRLTRLVGIEFGASVSRYAIKEQLTYYFDPPQPGDPLYNYKVASNRYDYFSPLLGLRGSWRWFSLSAGVKANLFMFGKTKNRFGEVFESGPEPEKEVEARLDIQDQPIYWDPSVVGGVANYLSYSDRNHGAAPTWMALYGRLDWRIWDKASTPILGFSYTYPLQEIQRTQNSKYGLVPYYSGYLKEVYLGTKISTLSLHLGWEF